MTNQKLYIHLFLLLILISLFILPTHGQVQEVLTGHKMPEVEIKEILNYKSSTAKLSDFKGKLLILDFWATYCAPCVGMFPRTDSLEKEFNGKVQFLGVTKEPRKKVDQFLNNMYRLRKLKPISVINDTIFSNLFYYSAIPYYVWIDKAGKVIATTGSEEITAKNIQAILNGQPPSFANRKDIRRRKLNNEKSLFVISNNFALKDSMAKRDEIQGSGILSYSVATKYIENAAGQLLFDQDHLNAYNISIDFLYRFCYDVGYYPSPVQGAFDSETTHLFEMNNELLNKITIPDDSPINHDAGLMRDWTQKNAVCYEIVYPKGISWKQKMQLVREDLDRYFARPMGFKVEVQKRIDSNTNVLRRTNKNISFLNKGGKPDEHHDRYSYSQHNMDLDRFLGILNSYYFQGKSTTFINKSGIKDKIDLDLTCDMTNLDAINDTLSKYGLRFNKESTEIDVLVFSSSRPINDTRH